jgi:hypothetical protein
MLKDLTNRYEHLIRGYGIDKWGAKDFDGKEFVKGLTSIQTLPVCRGCRKGGGNEVCRMRPCASERKLSDCIECDKTKSCENREALKKVREGALAVGMLVKAQGGHSDHQQLIKKWIAEIGTKCPTCGAENGFFC